MSESPTVASRQSTVEFTAADGAASSATWRGRPLPVMAAIICHPHPHVRRRPLQPRRRRRCSTALPPADIAALRFDFRDEFSGGAGERLDALAAIDDIAAAVPGVPIVAFGYSFGALIALGLDDDRVTALGLVAPPLAMTPDVAAPTVPTLVLIPAHDQFSPPSVSARSWRHGLRPRVEHRRSRWPIIPDRSHRTVAERYELADASSTRPRPTPPHRRAGAHQAHAAVGLSPRRRLPSPP